MIPKGYKKTEVGVIPEGWFVVNLGQISVPIIGLTYSPQDVYRDGILVLRSSNIQNSKLAFEDNVYVKCQVPERVFVQENDILICVRNGSRQLIGKCALITKDLVGSAFGAFMAILRSSSSKFIFFCFQSESIQHQIAAVMGATINQITNRDLKSFMIPLPPLDEQKRIAGVLGDVDALIQKLEALIAKKRDIKQASMQELLTGKRRLPGFTGVWETKKLGEICPLQRGFDLPNRLLQAGKYPVVYSNGVMSYHSKFQVHGPGIVTGRSGTIGKVTFISGDYWPHNTALWVTTFRSCTPYYIYFLLISIGLERFATGSGVPTLNRNDVHSFAVRIPTVKEQIVIAQVLSDMDAEIVQLEARLGKTKEMKAGLMQELLTGRIRLRGGDL